MPSPFFLDDWSTVRTRRSKQLIAVAGRPPTGVRGRRGGFGSLLPQAPTLAPVLLAADASPAEVIEGEEVTVVGVIRRGFRGDPFSPRPSLDFRPHGGDWRKLESVSSGEDGLLSTEVRATRSGNFRFRYAGSATNEPGT